MFLYLLSVLVACMCNVSIFCCTSYMFVFLGVYAVVYCRCIRILELTLFSVFPFPRIHFVYIYLDKNSFNVICLLIFYTAGACLHTCRVRCNDKCTCVCVCESLCLTT